MNKKIYLLFVLFVVSLPKWSNATTFTTTSSEGVTISFTIYNESQKTAWVSPNAIDVATEGTLTIPSVANGYTITGVYNVAFRNCSKLDKIVFPSTITSFQYYNNCFDGCSANIEVDTENTKYISRNGALYERYDNGCGLLFAGGQCTTFTIENDVTSMFNGAFYNSPQLTTITFEESSNAISLSSNSYSYYDPAFKNCPLTEAIINREIITYTSSVSRPFKNNTTLEEVTLGSQIDELKDYEFYGCTNLATITIQGNIYSIGYLVLDGTAWMTNTAAENGIKYLGNLAIAYDGTTTDVVFKNTTTCVAGGLFINATLGSITLPSGINKIPKTMFACCTIEELIIPANINRITYNSFYQGYSTITTIGTLIIEDSNTPLVLESKQDATTAAFRKVEIGTVFIGRPLQTYRYSEGSQDYGYPFGETTINKAIIMKDMTTGQMFYNSKVNEVEFPKDMSNIADYTFYGCTTLTKIIAKSNTPPTVSSNSFYNPYYKNATLYVPLGYKENYSGADYWKDFNKITYYNADELTVPSYNICTYSSSNNLDFSSVIGLSAYVISNFNSTEGTLTLSPVTTVQAGEGLLLKGNSGDYIVPHTTTDATYTNYLVGVPTTTSISPTDGDYTNFVLVDGTFYALSQAEQISAKEAYLQLPSATINQENLSRGFTPLENSTKEKCTTPTIVFENGKLNFSCETEGVEYHYTIQPEPISNTGNNVNVDYPQTALVSVYVTKEGYEDSEMATKEIDVYSLKGDVNGDGIVTVTDAVEVMDIILNNGSAPN